MTTLRFDVKDPAEKVVLTFDMTNGLSTGEILTGSPTVTCTVLNGVDGSPSSVLNGAASLDGTAKKVLVPVQAGVDGVDYIVHATCSTTNGLKMLALGAILPVRS